MAALPTQTAPAPDGGPSAGAPLARRSWYRPSSRSGGPASFVLRYLLSAAIILAALFPLAWMAISGFKARNEVVTSPFQFFPDVWMPENYAQILADPGFTRALAVSFAGAVAFSTLTLAVNSMAAYVFARLDFAFKNVLWPAVLMTMFIPQMAILITSYIVVTRMGMLNTFWVLLVPGAASAVHVFFIRQFYLGIPTSLEEAALIDGAGRWKIFTHIFLPMSKPVFVVVGITSFLVFWNAYVWPILTITEPDSPLTQIQQYLATFRSERRVEYGLLLAGSTLAATPVIVLFLIFQRYIISGIRISGIK
ncbi:carbohydrate ABC transporter permease [Ruania alba]|uniref:Multiple sugar transport system permease protein n=1 Tax=Ruania alba TaxID=648782 RepID=A0A1H5EZN1_9MICO|nr:carbohydrate ABC transporter permease [Ruania alba]SED96596.1 multiple sugar transport system permease protein [Ruania alba]